MRIRPSKNKQAVQEALDMFELDGHTLAKREDGTVRGPRGILNARRLGLSKHRYRAAKTAKRKVPRAWVGWREKRAYEAEASEKAAAQ